MHYFGECLLLVMALVLGGIQESGGLSTDPIGPDHLERYQGATPNPGQVTGKPSAYKDVFNDEGWPQQWFAHDYRTTEGPVMDHNLVPVYRMGITGKGVKVAVVDVGFEKHPDLVKNYIPELFVDLKEHLSFPAPSQNEEHPEHGTNTMGLIAMVANNSRCGVGVAFGAKVAGIKLNFISAKGKTLGPGVSFGLDHLDIYSNSWTSTDHISSMKEKMPLLKKALQKGVTKGRSGKGAIYVFAAGNGKKKSNNCGADVIINMVDTIPIAAASNRGLTTIYSERCPGIFATAYSGDIRYEKELLYTTGLSGSCERSYSGTSGAAPIASGIIALALEANPQLTYRDIQHLIAMSSEVAPLANNPKTWYKNKAGFWVSNDFGFGLLNAKNMVTLAAKPWRQVPDLTKCTVKYKGDYELFDKGSKLELTINTNTCRRKLQKGRHETVNSLEQVVLTVSLHYLYRGAISFRIKSPAGTETTLLEPRVYDLYRDGLKNWRFRSLHTWGENPKGNWKIYLEVKDWLRYQQSKRLDFMSRLKNEPLHLGLGPSGRLEHVSITLYGTETKPEHMYTPRTYSAFRLDDGRTNLSS